jgi:MFS family permease
MSESPPNKSALGRNLALASALLGWLFDGAEMGMFSLIGRPALRELLGNPEEALVGFWFGAVTAGFLVGAATGGVLFGWLGDRFGRIRAMTLSVLTYALFTGACGLSRTPGELATLRFIASLGMGGEWSLGVALVMELWPNSSRAFLAGLIGGAGNVGYLLVALLGMAIVGSMPRVSEALLAAGMSPETTAHLTASQGWRLLLFCGAAPAVLTLLIRLCVPESDEWVAERERGATVHWQTRDLLGVLCGSLGAIGVLWVWAGANLPLHETLAATEFGATMREQTRLLLEPAPAKLVATLFGLAIALVGYMYPVTRYIQRSNQGPAGAKIDFAFARRRLLLAAGLSGVALLGSWASVQWAPTWADKLTHGEIPDAKSYTQIASALGASLGAFLAALAGDWLGRRNAYRMLCVVSYVSILWLYKGHDAYDNGLLLAVFIAGFCTASFYGWLPLYLPELFPTSIRATGQGFGFNFGRILAAIGVLQTGTLMSQFKGDYSQACTIMSAVYLVGLVVIQFAPETRGCELPD